MKFYQDLRAIARPLKGILPRRPKLYDNKDFLTYIARKGQGLRQRADEIDTIALRGSTADYAFLPDRTHRAYNFGIISSDLYTTYHQYKYACRLVPNLRNVLVYGAVFLPGYQLSKTSERYRAISLRHFFNIPIQEDNDFKRRYISHIERKCRSLRVTPTIEDYRGYDPKTYYNINVSARDRVYAHVRENRREPDQINWLQRLLDEATIAKHKVYVIIPPFRSDYKAELERFITPEDAFRKFYRLDLKNHKIIDYYRGGVGDECFGDTEHLNEVGARHLTDKIMRQISGL